MSIAERRPAPERGRWLTLAAPAAAWVAAYWVNGWLRDRFLHDASGWRRPGRRDDHFFLQGTGGTART